MFRKSLQPMMKFENMRGIIALKDGMLAILPLTVVGSLFLIMGQLPFEGLNKSIASVFWSQLDRAVYASIFRNFCYYGSNFLFFNCLFLC